MKVCVTAGASGLDAPVDPRFGRCPFLVVVDLDSMNENSVPNTSAGASGGAGIQAAQAVAKLGVTILITGNIGPNALQTLSAAGIDVYQQLKGTVREAAEQFKRGGLQKITSPSVPPHAGMGQGLGRGGGRGRGGPGTGQGQRSSGGQGAGRGGGQGAGNGAGVGGGRGGRGQ